MNEETLKKLAALALLFAQAVGAANDGLDMYGEAWNCRDFVKTIDELTTDLYVLVGDSDLISGKDASE